jgi:tRNA U34 5-methylaminomethyl-2-thiouridine-forming methyltransferase MnmC
MLEIITKDGSISFMSEEYGEAYHALSGAVEEAIIKFIQPTSVADRALSGNLRILDIGFGLGYKSLLAMSTARKSNPGCIIDIVTLEKDTRILATEVSVFPGLENDYRLLRSLLKSSMENKGLASSGSVSFTVMLGDATAMIRLLRPSFDIVYLDPFSPKKNPEMWSEPFFRDIRSLMMPGSVLATYSCAAIVRKNLRSAGFIVKDVEPFKRRGPSTLAFFP